MPAHRIPADLDKMYRVGFVQVPDPGDDETLDVQNKGLAVFRIRTATAETRSLPNPDAYGLGTRIIVMLSEDGGDLLVDNVGVGGTSDVTLTAAGDYAEFICTEDDPDIGSRAWVPANFSGTLQNPFVAPAVTGDFPTAGDVDDLALIMNNLLVALDGNGVVDNQVTGLPTA